VSVVQARRVSWSLGRSSPRVFLHADALIV